MEREAREQSASGLERRAVQRGDRQLRRTAFAFAEDLRGLRLRAGVSQAMVGRAIGVDRSVICRMEAGDLGVSLEVRSRAAATLGATLKLSLYPDGAPLIHDAAHARIIERLLAARHPRWRATLEAPIPGPGHRSTDVRLDHGQDVILFEVETQVRRLEEVIRGLHAKRAAVVASLADATVRAHAVLVLPPTRHHRSLARSHPQTMRVAFPIAAAELRVALAAPRGSWPGDGLLWIGRS